MLQFWIRIMNLSALNMDVKNELFVSFKKQTKKRKSHVSILSWSQMTAQGWSLGFGTWLQFQQILHHCCCKALQRCVSKGRLALSERPYVYRNRDLPSTGIGGKFSTEFVSFSSKSYRFCPFLVCWVFLFSGKVPNIKNIHWLLNCAPVQLFPTNVSLFWVYLEPCRRSSLQLFRFSSWKERRKSFKHKIVTVTIAEEYWAGSNAWRYWTKAGWRTCV